LRQVPCDLYPDAWHRPLFARRLERARRVRSPFLSLFSLKVLKKRSLKYGESVVNRRALRNRVWCFDEKGRMASITSDAVTTGYPLVHATANLPQSNKSKCVRDIKVGRTKQVDLWSIGDHINDHFMAAFYKDINIL